MTDDANADRRPVSRRDALKTAGLAGAAALSRFLESLLFGVKTLDLFTFVAAPIVFGLAALIACGAPALRAASAEPAAALRHE